MRARPCLAGGSHTRRVRHLFLEKWVQEIRGVQRDNRRTEQKQNMIVLIIQSRNQFVHHDEQRSIRRGHEDVVQLSIRLEEY